MSIDINVPRLVFVRRLKSKIGVVLFWILVAAAVITGAALIGHYTDPVTKMRSKW